MVRLENLRGKTVLLHFWATWCGVCRYETSVLNALHARLSGPEALLSVVADSENVDHVRRVIAERGIRYPVLLGTPDVLERYRVSAAWAGGLAFCTPSYRAAPCLTKL